MVFNEVLMSAGNVVQNSFFRISSKFQVVHDRSEFPFHGVVNAAIQFLHELLFFALDPFLCSYYWHLPPSQSMFTV